LVEREKLITVKQVLFGYIEAGRGEAKLVKNKELTWQKRTSFFQSP